MTEEKSTSDLFKEGIEKNKEKKYREALECFEKVIEIDPEYEEVWFQMGWTYSHIYQNEKPVERDDEIFDDIYYNPFGVSPELDNLSNKVIECYVKAVSLAPEEYGAWYNLGKHYQDELKDYQKAIECYEKVLRINPEFSYAWNNMGLTYDKMGDMEKAAECYKKAVEFDPENDIAWVNFAILSHSLKKYEESLEYYEKAYEINPTVFQAQLSWTAAIESIRIKVAPNIQNKNIWIKLGIGSLKLRRFKQATECFKKIIEIDPKNYEVWKHIGTVYINWKDHDGFMECFEDISKLLKDLKRISIITTSEGPFIPDVFWLIESSSDIAILPSEGKDSDFLKTAQNLPDFDNEVVIKAMTSHDNDFFVSWEKKN